MFNKHFDRTDKILILLISIYLVVLFIFVLLFILDRIEKHQIAKKGSSRLSSKKTNAKLKAMRELEATSTNITVSPKEVPVKEIPKPVVQTTKKENKPVETKKKNVQTSTKPKVNQANTKKKNTNNQNNNKPTPKATNKPTNKTTNTKNNNKNTKKTNQNNKTNPSIKKNNSGNRNNGYVSPTKRKKKSKKRK